MDIDYPKPKNLTKDRTSTTRVSIYCTTSDKDQWTTEAESGYSSRSKYLYELVQESRRYRQEGFLCREHRQDEIKQLKIELERLHIEIQDRPGQRHQPVEDPALVNRALIPSYQSLKEITETVLNEDSVFLETRRLVERSLFGLAQCGEVDYRRGHGWRLREDR